MSWNLLHLPSPQTTEILQDIGILGYWDIEISGYSDIELLGYSDIGTLEYLLTLGWSKSSSFVSSDSFWWSPTSTLDAVMFSPKEPIIAISINIRKGRILSVAIFNKKECQCQLFDCGNRYFLPFWKVSNLRLTEIGNSFK